MNGTAPVAGPVADFDLPANAAVGQSVTFIDQSASSAGIASWSWNLNGTIYTEQHPKVVLSQNYNLVTLTVIDRDGRRAKASKILILGQMSGDASHEGYAPVDFY